MTVNNAKLMLGLHKLKQWAPLLSACSPASIDDVNRPIIMKLGYAIRKLFDLTFTSSLDPGLFEKITALFNNMDIDHQNLQTLRFLLERAGMIEAISTTFFNCTDYLCAASKASTRATLSKFQNSHMDAKAKADAFRENLLDLLTQKQQDAYFDALFAIEGKSLATGFCDPLTSLLHYLPDNFLEFLYSHLNLIEELNQAFIEFSLDFTLQSENFILRQPEVIRLLRKVLDPNYRAILETGQTFSHNTYREIICDGRKKAVPDFDYKTNYEQQIYSYILSPLKSSQFNAELQPFRDALERIENPTNQTEVNTFICEVKQNCPKLLNHCLTENYKASLLAWGRVRDTGKEREYNLRPYGNFFNSPVKKPPTSRVALENSSNIPLSTLPILFSQQSSFGSSSEVSENEDPYRVEHL